MLTNTALGKLLYASGKLKDAEIRPNAIVSAVRICVSRSSGSTLLYPFPFALPLPLVLQDVLSYTLLSKQQNMHNLEHPQRSEDVFYLDVSLHFAFRFLRC